MKGDYTDRGAADLRIGRCEQQNQDSLTGRLQ
jgi:hypothetical protein